MKNIHFFYFDYFALCITRKKQKFSDFFVATAETETAKPSKTAAVQVASQNK